MARFVGVAIFEVFACCDLSSLEMSPLRSLPHLPIQFAILKSRYPAWSLGSRGAESRSESTWRVRLAPHPHPIKRRFLYGNTRPGSTTTPRLGDLRPGMCSWTRSHLVWRVRPSPSHFSGSRSAGSPISGLWSRGPTSNHSFDIPSCLLHPGYLRPPSLISRVSCIRRYPVPLARSDARALPSHTPRHCSLDRDAPPTSCPPGYLRDTSPMSFARSLYIPETSTSRHIAMYVCSGTSPRRTFAPLRARGYTTVCERLLPFEESSMHIPVCPTPARSLVREDEFGYGLFVEPLRASRTLRASAQIGDLFRGSTVIRDSLVPAFS